MQSLNINACYTSRFPHMLKPSLFLPLFLLAGAWAQQGPQSFWAGPANDFAQQIISRSGALSAITLTFENLSSLPPADLEALKKDILDAFRTAGVRLVSSELASADVRISVS